MLQLINISKQYITGGTTVDALKGIDISFRTNEFVSILGPSGGGKTTLLNIIGGLDQYTKGDLIISGKSTKDYSNRDWDSYRNHSVGFVFQSYNLITHQTVLSNVELALTLSGVGKAERRRRAKEALDAVGLTDQIKKKPNQLSGGQMQRVAIARALVNDPDILLADEPTGALDTETSVQIMNILKAVAKDRLVIMVTHNPELAEQYSTRIVRLKDGAILDDSNPFDGKEEKETSVKQKKISMSFRTALTLSLNNLMTKRGRTILTAFAGSIGIIGIALILSMSTGVNDYINDIQKDTMASYPITIEKEAVDYTSMLSAMQSSKDYEADHDKMAVYSNSVMTEMVQTMIKSRSIKNNLASFKKYLESDTNKISQYASNIVYSYDTKFSTFTYDPEGIVVNTAGKSFGASNRGSQSSFMMQTNTMAEMLPASTEGFAGEAVISQYDVLYGSWPNSFDEVVLVLDENNEITDSVLYNLGLLPSSEYDEKVKAIMKGEDVTNEEHSWSYEEITKQKFYVVCESDFYVKNENGTNNSPFEYVADNEIKIKKLVETGIPLHISGVVRVKEGITNAPIAGVVGYTRALTDAIMKRTEESAIVKAQKASTSKNIVNGLSFAPDNATKISDTKTYILNMSASEKVDMATNILASISSQISPDLLKQMETASDEELSVLIDQFLSHAQDSMILQIYQNYIADTASTYDEVLSTLGVVDKAYPSAISIYADSFENKDLIAKGIEEYNASASKEDKITYTDYVALLMSSITTIVNVITYVLVAFVAVSLVVSSIMIGIITYISVLERTKEIGILRAIGGSKKDISRVFSAETFIIGLFSGGIGVGITCLLNIPINMMIHVLADTDTVNASLPVMSAVILVCISIVLTLIAGLFPSRIAARKDPVAALRSE